MELGLVALTQVHLSRSLGVAERPFGLYDVIEVH